jgi:glycerol-3-phosphate acyltransferase PlsX
VTSADLVRFALVGWAYAKSWGMSDPAVGLLTIGEEDGKGDRLRRDAHEALLPMMAAAGITYVGGVEGHDVALGQRCQVIVTDGFTGNVLIKGLEGAIAWAAQRMATAYGSSDAANRVVHQTRTSDFAGGMLLGVNGVAVVGHGAGTADEIAACIRLAARVVAGGLVTATRDALSGVEAG